MKKKIILTIEFSGGSDFQEDHLRGILKGYGEAVCIHAAVQHRQNLANFTLTDSEGSFWEGGVAAGGEYKPQSV